MIRFLPLAASPDDLLRRISGEAGLAFLDGSAAGTHGFSVLTWNPRRVIVDDLPPVRLGAARRGARTETPPFRPPSARPGQPPSDHHGPPPFVSGWIGFAAYESAGLWNPDLRTLDSEPALPRAWWGRYAAALSYRHADGCWFVSRSDDPEGEAAEAELLATIARAGFEVTGSVERLPAPAWLPGGPSLPDPASVADPASVQAPASAAGGASVSDSVRFRDPVSLPGPASVRAPASIAGGAVVSDSSRIPGAAWLPEPSSVSGLDPGFFAGAPRSSTSPLQHARDVARILDWIGRGHIYQADLTYRISAPFEGSAASFFLALKRQGPARYAALLQPEPGLTILSSSPERFLQVAGSSIRTRPIKGTRPRDLADPRRDRALARELLRSEKDRAELTMIVDLERNDLGRICRAGSVRTARFPRLESYRNVHHLSASIRGRLVPDLTLRDLFRATFPGGSVTGAPKIRAMEILAEHETRPRFVYTGALGYVDDRGGLDLALTIRTLWCHAGKVHLGVGGGIVADSDPAAEWEETRHKARAMLAALAEGGPISVERVAGSAVAGAAAPASSPPV